MDALAVVLEAPERLTLSRVGLSAPSEDDVVVDIAWSGISTGTEKLLWSGRMPPFPGMGYPLLPGYESVQWYGFLAPARTPREIINKVHADLVQVLQSPETRKRFATDAADTVGNTPEEFARHIQSELTKWARVARDAGIEKQ